MTGQVRRLRSPIHWFGGKGAMVAKLLPLIPDHFTYVEPFGGGASLLVAHEPSKVEVYNDLNSGLVNLFRVIRNPAQFEKLHRLVELTPYAREEFIESKLKLKATTDPVEQAYRWFVLARMCFGGKFADSWGYARTSNRGMAGAVSGWLAAIDRLPELSQRLMRVQVEHNDGFKVINCYDAPDTFFYIDPPYVPSTRKGGGYEHELNEEDHERLVKLLLSLKGKVLLSGYPNPTYQELERAGWQRRDWETVCHASGRTRTNGVLGTGAAKRMQMRTESVWFNYEMSSNKEMALAR